MTNPKLTHIQAVIDRSGSMAGIRSDAEGGFNAFIESQQAIPGECVVSLTQFDTSYEPVFSDVPIHRVPPLSIEPRGATALLDAVGRTVIELGTRLATLPEQDRPGAVIVCIVTDGLENSSKEFSYQAVADLIAQQERQYSWTFLYMGSGQDAIEEGMRMGISRERSLTYSRGNSRGAYEAASGAVGRTRELLLAGPDVTPDEIRAAAAFSPEERHMAQ
ncbi:VWA domain-containing protein [Brooklawnia cerclae]|uniref:VWA domain-containing protein n=1 Tax=Brooklawnia cerclae TaxID=349934 RepID=A0ABX0SBE4_9ACTN|nr:vWA domain-containing protein [Brooklawnia cerclae]NIH55712.1 hypothetical protein [Brooklawnia cerclae]